MATSKTRYARNENLFHIVIQKLTDVSLEQNLCQFLVLNSPCVVEYFEIFDVFVFQE